MIQKNVSLFPFNTFAMDVGTRYYASFEDVDELGATLEESAALSAPRMILGGGSNVLFRSDYDGLILHNRIRGIEWVSDEGDEVFVRVGAGENWHAFVMWCIENGLAGVENLSLIPGSVGAGPMQNIGAYGVELREVFHELEAYHLEEGRVEKFSNSACEFGYRESVFKKSLKGQFAIISVTFKLSRKPDFKTSYGAIEQELNRMGVEELSIRCVSQAVINIRRSKLPDPRMIGNAGSFFKNPVISATHFEDLKRQFPEMPNYPAGEGLVKVPAGWLIDNSGWKGKRFGNYGVHERQALVLVNYGGAQGNEIYDLSEKIIDDIRSTYGIELEREVNIIP